MRGKVKSRARYSFSQAPEFTRPQLSNDHCPPSQHPQRLLLSVTSKGMDKFFSDISKSPKAAPSAAPIPTEAEEKPEEKKALPKGVVLGKDGKP